MFFETEVGDLIPIPRTHTLTLGRQQQKLRFLPEIVSRRHLQCKEVQGQPLIALTPIGRNNMYLRKQNAACVTELTRSSTVLVADGDTVYMVKDKETQRFCGPLKVRNMKVSTPKKSRVLLDNPKLTPFRTPAEAVVVVKAKLPSTKKTKKRKAPVSKENPVRKKRKLNPKKSAPSGLKPLPRRAKKKTVEKKKTPASELPKAKPRLKSELETFRVARSSLKPRRSKRKKSSWVAPRKKARAPLFDGRPQEPDSRISPMLPRNKESVFDFPSSSDDNQSADESVNKKRISAPPKLKSPAQEDIFLKSPPNSSKSSTKPQLKEPLTSDILTSPPAKHNSPVKIHDPLFSDDEESEGEATKGESKKIESDHEADDTLNKHSDEESDPLSQFLEKRKSRKRLTQSTQKTKKKPIASEEPVPNMDLSFGSVHLSDSASPIFPRPFSLNFPLTSQEFLPPPTNTIGFEHTVPDSTEFLPPNTYTERRNHDKEASPTQMTETKLDEEKIDQHNNEKDDNQAASPKASPEMRAPSQVLNLDDLLFSPPNKPIHNNDMPQKREMFATKSPLKKPVAKKVVPGVKRLSATPSQDASILHSPESEVKAIQLLPDSIPPEPDLTKDSLQEKLDMLPSIQTPQLTPSNTLNIQDFESPFIEDSYGRDFTSVSQYADQPRPVKVQKPPEKPYSPPNSLNESIVAEDAVDGSKLPDTIVNTEPEVQVVEPETQFEFSHYSYPQNFLGDEVENPDTQERNDLISDYRLLEIDEEESDTADLLEDLLHEDVKQKTTKDRLSADDWSEVFRFIDVRDRLTWSRVSKRWHSILKCPRLWKEVSLVRLGNKITDNQLAEFVCGQWNQCTKLDLGKAHRLTNEAIVHIGDACKKLREIKIAHAPKINSKGVLSLLVCKKLTAVSLVACENVDDDSLRYLSRLKSLSRVDVSFCPLITAIGVKHLAEGKSKGTLTHLNVFHTNVSNEACQSLVYFRRLEVLKIQNLESTGLTHIRLLPNLMELHLLRSKLKEVAILSLLKSPASLVEISFTDCPPITSRIRRKFERQKIRVVLP